MSTIARWNTLADGLVDWALSAAVTSAVLLVVVALVWLAIRRRASAHLGHLLFLLPLVPLVLPDLASVELPAWVVPGEASAPPVDSDVAALPPAPQAASLDFPVLEFEEHGGAGLASSSAPAVSRAVAPTWKAWAVLLWAVTVTGLVARLVTVQRWTDRLLRSAPELGGREGDRVRARLERLGPRFGLRRALRVVETDLVPTPAVWGLRRPLLAFDRGLAASLDPEQLDWVLSHELAGGLLRRELPRPRRPAF